MLKNIKGIKMTGMTNAVMRQLLRLRAKEIRTSEELRWIMVTANASGKNEELVFCFLCWQVSANALGIFSPVIVLTVFALLTNSQTGAMLDTNTAFTSIAILTMVTHPANMVMTIVPRAIASLASFERINAFLLQAPHQRYRSSIASRRSPHGTRELAIALSNVSICFSTKAEPVLDKLDLEVELGSFVGCVGKAGSGKSTLAKTIVGEAECVTGSVLLSSEMIGYCAQTPWLQSLKLHQVVCGVYSEVDPDWYTRVIKACCLDDDIMSMPAQDDTLIGSNGINVSGGQRQRLVRLAKSAHVHSIRTCWLFDRL
jgi:ATP-binding cassette subfamily C (CFTR/MRP) protein 1